MSKAVMLSIRPKWCEKIASGEKTIEVRKTKPKLETPFKCYIYCTLPKYPHEDFIATIQGHSFTAAARSLGSLPVKESLLLHTMAAS